MTIAGRTIEKLRRAAGEIGGGTEPVVVDLTDEDSVAGLFAKVGRSTTWP